MTGKELMVRKQRWPFSEHNKIEWPMISFHRRKDHFYNGFFENLAASDSWINQDHFSSFTPKLNVSECESSVEISIELPGMNEKDVEVSLAKRILTIKGEKKGTYRRS